MKTRVGVLLLLGAWSGGPVFAQALPLPGHGDGTASPAVVPPNQPASTTFSVRGTIDKFDPLTRVLSLATPTGTLRFTIASTTRIRQHWHTVDASALQAPSARATVRYTESGGTRVVESVHVFGTNEESQR